MIEGHERTLLAAQGYCELGMFDDALEELGSLPAEVAQLSPVVELRTVVLMQARRWKLALTASRSLCRVAPDKSTGFIHAAFCLHELGRTDEARDTLLSGPDALHAEPTYPYNLACYECALGT
ncbi:MAG: tetratricopeptide repeat protein, partial [Chthoniobacter sp.]|uniref:tetratricopeptide repeat protein n=1 Tax=Chthoniobacter sp. TaxID=2510640 RepID=UPI0032A767ED